MRVTSLSLLFAIPVVAVLVLSGCTATDSASGSSGSNQSGADTQDPSFTGPVPSFAGAWASEFTSAYRLTTTDFERLALDDESISDAEFSEMESTFNSCLEDQGLTFESFKPHGGYDFGLTQGITPEQGNRIADECSASSGVNTVGYLYFAMQRNPQNLDEATIMADCLVRSKVAPKGYTGADYLRDAPTMSFPSADGPEGAAALEACAADPLNLFG